MDMSLASLLNLLHLVSEEYDRLHQVVVEKEASIDSAKDEILRLIKELQAGRFELNHLGEQGDYLDREAGDLASEITELTRLRDVKANRRTSISELMKQTDDSATKKSLRRERAELGTTLEELNLELEKLRSSQEGYRVQRAKLSREIEAIEIQLGELERDFKPLQSRLVSFEEKCSELELGWLRELLEAKLAAEDFEHDVKASVAQLLASGSFLLEEYRLGNGLFRRDFQRAELPPLVSELQIWALVLEDEASLGAVDAWPTRAQWVETYQGFRFAIGRSIRTRRLADVTERLEEFIALDSLVGAMARALYAVNRASQTERHIALMEWLRLESKLARTSVIDEARIVSGSSQKLYDLWVSIQ